MSARLLRAAPHIESKPPPTILATQSALGKTFDALRSYTGSWTWGPLVNLSRNVVLNLLQRIEVGQIIVTDCNGTVTKCGGTKNVRVATKDGQTESNALVSELKVVTEAFWVRVLLFADMVRRRCRASRNRGLG